MKYKAIAAMTKNGIIGDDGEIPWHYPEDLRYFRNVTQNHPVVMGRKTYESICSNFSDEFIRENGGPLQPHRTGRRQIIFTRQEDYNPIANYGVKVVHSCDEAKWILQRYTETKPLKNLNWEEPFIIGGSEIYDMFWDDIDEFYLTIIHEEYGGDTRFPRDIRIGEEWRVRFNPFNSIFPNNDELSYMLLEKKK